MADIQFFPALTLTGGGNALDGINHRNVDGLGNALRSGDIGVVADPDNNLVYFHKYSTSNSDPESSPDTIIPDSNTSGQGAWSRFLTVSAGGGGGGTPASTVTDETSFGISSVVGTDTEYARQDHTHGTPTNPVTAHESTYTHTDIALNTADRHAQTHSTHTELDLANAGHTFLQTGASASVRDLDTYLKDFLPTPQDFGATGDAQQATNGSIDTGVSTTTLTTGTAKFVAGDVGKAICIAGAGAAGVTLTTTIASFTSTTEVEITDAASTTVSNTDIMWGTDDTTAFTNLLAAHNIVYLPPASYTLTSGFTLESQRTQILARKSYIYVLSDAPFLTMKHDYQAVEGLEIFLPSTNTEAAIKLYATNAITGSSMQHCLLRNIIISAPNVAGLTGSNDYMGLEFESETLKGFAWNQFENIWIDGAATGIQFTGQGTAQSSWFNSNNFQNINILLFTTAINNQSMRLTGNQFGSLTLQTSQGGGGATGLAILYGTANTFNLDTWMDGSSPDTLVAYNLGATTADNIITGNLEYTSVTDSGSNHVNTTNLTRWADTVSYTNYTNVLTVNGLFTAADGAWINNSSATAAALTSTPTISQVADTSTWGNLISTTFTPGVSITGGNSTRGVWNKTAFTSGQTVVLLRSFDNTLDHNGAGTITLGHANASVISILGTGDYTNAASYYAGTYKTGSGSVTGNYYGYYSEVVHDLGGTHYHFWGEGNYPSRLGGTLTVDGASTLTGGITNEVDLLGGAHLATNQVLKLAGSSPTYFQDNSLYKFGGGTSTTVNNIIDTVNKVDALTQAEVDILDGATVTTAELNILDGVTSTTAELNILDGVTSTAAELNKLDGFTGTATDLNNLVSMLGRTWNNVTLVAGTEYQNTLGYPIQIMSLISSSANGALARFETGAVSGSRSNRGFSDTLVTAGDIGCVQGMVPPGWYYAVNVNSGTGTVAYSSAFY